MSKAPVQSAVGRNTDTRVSVPEQKYQQVVNFMKANNGAEARAIESMLGSEELRNRFLATTFSLLARESDVLRKATVASIIDAIKTAASMGLEPLTDDGAIIVYGDKATFQPMYQGYLKRMRNTGQVVDVDVQIVYENDVFEMELGTSPNIKHLPAKIVKDSDNKVVEDRGNYLGIYAWALMHSGTYIIEWMTEAEINQVRDQFGNKSKDNWRKSWGEMGRKTLIRRLRKRLPGSSTDQLTRVEAENDRLLEDVVEVKDDMADLRRLAHNAVAPEASVEPTPAIAEGKAEPNAVKVEGHTDAMLRPLEEKVSPEST